MRIYGFLSSMSILALASCGGGSAGERQVGSGPCSEPSQCASRLCLEINGESYCSQECGTCPSGMYCDSALFSPIGLSVCVKGAASTPVQPQTELPSLPCKTDADCPSGLVCATFKGQKDCTKECSNSDQCAPTQLCPFKLDFMECSKDEGADRTVCLPKQQCSLSPQSCITVVPDCAFPAPDAGGQPDAIEPDTGAQDTGLPSPPGCEEGACDGPCCPYGACLDTCYADCMTKVCTDPMNFEQCVSCLGACEDKCGLSIDCKSCLKDLVECADKYECDYGPPSKNECIGANCCMEYRSCF